MSAEVTITVKNDDKTLKTNHLVYEAFAADAMDPILADLVADTVKQFNAEVDDIKIRIDLEVT